MATWPSGELPANTPPAPPPPPRYPFVCALPRRIRSRHPDWRFRALAMSSPAACGTGSKSMSRPPHARTTLKSHSTSLSAYIASRSARFTTSPLLVHSHRNSPFPTVAATDLPTLTPTEHEMCPRCTIAARSANASAVAAPAASPKTWSRATPRSSRAATSTYTTNPDPPPPVPPVRRFMSLSKATSPAHRTSSAVRPKRLHSAATAEVAVVTMRPHAAASGTETQNPPRVAFGPGMCATTVATSRVLGLTPGRLRRRPSCARRAEPGFTAAPPALDRARSSSAKLSDASDSAPDSSPLSPDSPPECSRRCRRAWSQAALAGPSSISCLRSACGTRGANAAIVATGSGEEGIRRIITARLSGWCESGGTISCTLMRLRRHAPRKLGGASPSHASRTSRHAAGDRATSPRVTRALIALTCCMGPPSEGPRAAAADVAANKSPRQSSEGGSTTYTASRRVVARALRASSSSHERSFTLRGDPAPEPSPLGL